MRKHISKLVALLLICIIAFGNISVYASKNTDYLRGMDVVPGDFSKANEDEPITRGEYAYIMANLMTREELPPVDTKFSDVTKNDYFSGQVNYLAQLGIAGGYGDGTFGAADPLTLETAYVFLTRVLEFTGYVTFHSELQGKYTDLAYRIGLKPGKYTNAEGYVTKGGAADIAYDALTTELRGVHYRVTDGIAEIIDDANPKSNVMSHVLGISTYEGVVSDIDIPENKLTVTITKNAYSKNPVILNAGDEKTFEADASISVYEYNNLPVTVWIDKEGELVGISLGKEIDIRYVMVYSVNGDTSTDAAYAVSQIDRVMLYDDEEEYDVSEDATFTVNGKNFTGRYGFAGKLTRVVISKNEIINMESWDLEEAGLVTSVSDRQIKYTKGSQNQVLRNIDLYDTQLYIINGEIKSKKELSADTLMYYYADPASSYLVIVASNAVLSAPLEGVNTDALVIGNTAVTHDGSFYYETLTGEFAEYNAFLDGGASVLTDFFGRRVSAYLAPNGRLKYLTFALGAKLPEEFFGAVIGTKTTTTFGETETEILLWVLEGDVTKEIFKITDKTVYEDGLTLSYITSKANNLSGAGVFKFKAKPNGEITKISELENMHGFGAPVSVQYTSSTSNFGAYSGKVYFVDTASNKAVYFEYPTVYALYEVDGQFVAQGIEYSELAGEPSKGAILTAYGNGTSSRPSLVLLTGAVKTLGTGTVNGFVTDRSLVLGADDEEKYKLTIQTTNGVQEYIVPKDSGEAMTPDTYVSFTAGTRFSDSEIFVDPADIWDLSGSVDTWFGADAETLAASGYTKGIVKSVDENRIIFTDDSMVYFRPARYKVISIDLGGLKRQYAVTGIEDIVPGDLVITSAGDYGVTFVIAVKQ